MEQWIGEYYQQEVNRYNRPSIIVNILLLCANDTIPLSSVNQMAIVARHAIEQENKLIHELILPGIQFNVNEVRTYTYI